MPFIQALRCVGCGCGGLVQHNALLDCPACGRAFPVLAGVPVMRSDAAAERGPLMDPAAARDVLHRMGAPDHPISVLRVRRASGARLQEPPLPFAPVWHSEAVPRAMRPAEMLGITLRFRAGSDGLPATGERRCSIELRWAHAHGEELLDAAAAFPLAKDLQSGEQASIRVPLQSPAVPGRYHLALHLVSRGLPDGAARLGPLQIHVHEAAGGHVQTEIPGQSALGTLRTWLARHGPGEPRVLELDGGERPLAAALPCSRSRLMFQADEALLGLQLGQAVAPDGAARVCADLTTLPFAERAFSAIVCHGALHQVVDPVRMLRNARTHLHRGGFIALLAEPCDGAGPGFTRREYAQIIRAARLDAAELIIQDGTLHARLVPEAAHG